MISEAKVCALLQAECSASHGPLTVAELFAVPGAPVQWLVVAANRNPLAVIGLVPPSTAANLRSE